MSAVHGFKECIYGFVNLNLVAVSVVHGPKVVKKLWSSGGDSFILNGAGKIGAVVTGILATFGSGYAIWEGRNVFAGMGEMIGSIHEPLGKAIRNPVEATDGLFYPFDSFSEKGNLNKLSVGMLGLSFAVGAGTSTFKAVRFLWDVNDNPLLNHFGKAKAVGVGLFGALVTARSILNSAHHFREINKVIKRTFSALDKYGQTNFRKLGVGVLSLGICCATVFYGGKGIVSLCMYEGNTLLKTCATRIGIVAIALFQVGVMFHGGKSGLVIFPALRDIISPVLPYLAQIISQPWKVIHDGFTKLDKFGEKGSVKEFAAGVVGIGATIVSGTLCKKCVTTLLNAENSPLILEIAKKTGAAASLFLGVLVIPRALYSGLAIFSGLGKIVAPLSSLLGRVVGNPFKTISTGFTALRKRIVGAS